MATKHQRQQMDEIHAKIMDGYRRGVCDKDGHSEKRNGVFVAKPSRIPSRECVVFHSVGGRVLIDCRKNR